MRDIASMILFCGFIIIGWRLTECEKKVSVSIPPGYHLISNRDICKINSFINDIHKYHDVCFIYNKMKSKRNK